MFEISPAIELLSVELPAPKPLIRVQLDVAGPVVGSVVALALAKGTRLETGTGRIAHLGRDSGALLVSDTRANVAPI